MTSQQRKALGAAISTKIQHQKACSFYQSFRVLHPDATVGEYIDVCICQTCEQTRLAVAKLS